MACRERGGKKWDREKGIGGQRGGERVRGKERGERGEGEWRWYDDPELLLSILEGKSNKEVS